MNETVLQKVKRNRIDTRKRIISNLEFHKTMKNIFTGCKNSEVYSPMFQIEDQLYVVKNELVDETEIEIGIIEKEAQDLPGKNGERYKFKKEAVIHKVQGERIKGDSSKKQYCFLG